MLCYGMLWHTQWSNYQKISKGSHTIVNANEAMLLITGGSRTSESGEQIFPKFFDDFLGAFLKMFWDFWIFPQKKFIYSPKISDDLFFSHLFAFFPKKCSSILPKFLTTFFF